MGLGKRWMKEVRSWKAVAIIPDGEDCDLSQVERETFRMM